MSDDLYEIIENVMHSKSVKGLNRSLKNCLEVLESKNPEKRVFVKALNQHLASRGNIHKINALISTESNRLSNVYVHDCMESPIIYAAHMLISSYRIKDYKVKLQKLIRIFNEEFEDPLAKGLTNKEIYKALHFLQDKYKLFDIITCKADLEIFIFNNSHNEFNSLCDVYYDVNKPETYVKCYILLFAPRAEEHDPFQVLVHEIGHALQVALTHKSHCIPRSFIEMNKILDVYFDDDSIEAADAFADIFSTVAMNNSYLANHNSLIEFFPDNVLNLFDRYFSKLINYAWGNREILKKNKLDIMWD